MARLLSQGWQVSTTMFSFSFALFFFFFSPCLSSKQQFKKKKTNFIAMQTILKKAWQIQRSFLLKKKLDEELSQ